LKPPNVVRCFNTRKSYLGNNGKKIFSESFGGSDFLFYLCNVTLRTAASRGLLRGDRHRGKLKALFHMEISKIQVRRNTKMTEIMEKGMNEEVQTSVLNPVQLHILRMFSYMNSEAQLKELKQVLTEYYFNEVEKGMADLESKGLWGREQSDAVMNEHLRTPYSF